MSKALHDPAQDWDPKVYVSNAAFVAELGEPLLDLLAPKPGERILDLGCGDGRLTAKLAARGPAVVAVDASPDLIAAARQHGLDAHVMNGHDLAFKAEFDAVMSNAALHWMKDPDAVLKGVFRALKPGGRFVAEMGGQGNVARIVAAVGRALVRRGHPADSGNPWYFPSVDQYRAKLEGQGFTVREMSLFPRPTRLPGDVGGWLDTFAAPFLSVLSPAHRKAAREEAVAELQPVMADPSGVWWADYVRLRFVAVKP